MSKSKLGDVLKDAGIRENLPKCDSCGGEGSYLENYGDDDEYAIDCRFCDMTGLSITGILNQEVMPEQLVEIDFEKAKIALCEEWGIEIDELEQEENRYVIEILHILAQADILKFKSK
jgi:hypothetical protein